MAPRDAGVSERYSSTNSLSEHTLFFACGQAVKIFTARVCEHGRLDTSNGEPTAVDVITPIENWCLKHLGRKLPVTNVKDYYMIELWDDRAIQVIANTGEPVMMSKPS